VGNGLRDRGKRHCVHSEGHNEARPNTPPGTVKRGNYRRLLVEQSTNSSSTPRNRAGEAQPPRGRQRQTVIAWTPAGKSPKRETGACTPFGKVSYFEGKTLTAYHAKKGNRERLLVSDGSRRGLRRGAKKNRSSEKKLAASRRRKKELTIGTLIWQQFAALTEDTPVGGDAARAVGSAGILVVDSPRQRENSKGKRGKYAQGVSGREGGQ